MNFSEIKARLSRLDTASLADANKKIRVLDSGIRPVRLGLQMIGRAHTVRVLKEFRDDILLKTGWGTHLVKAYYRYSPPIAAYIAERDWLRSLVRTLLLPVVGLVSLVM